MFYSPSWSSHFRGQGGFRGTGHGHAGIVGSGSGVGGLTGSFIGQGGSSGTHGGLTYSSTAGSSKTSCCGHFFSHSPKALGGHGFAMVVEEAGRREELEPSQNCLPPCNAQ